MPFAEFKPSYLRSMVTTDFALRQGNWKQLELDGNGVETLKNAVNGLLGVVERTADEDLVEIDTEQPANTTSAADIAFTVYKTSENTPFEKGLRHLLGLKALETQTASNDEGAGAV